MKNKIKVLLTLLIVLLLTGCFKRDEMEDINVITTTYPIEYITSRIYGDYANISSIYPKATIASEYQMTNKQIKDYSKKDLFIYNGLGNEKEYAIKFLNNNKKLKIIDCSFGINYNDSEKELWLNPSNALMVAQNIRNDLENYITNKKLIENIDIAYNNLKVDITQIDTEFTRTADSSLDTRIIVYDESFNFLKKYGFEVINLTKDGEVLTKNVATAQSLLASKKLSYIFIDSNIETPETVKTLQEKTKCEVLTLNTLLTIKDEELNNNEDYLSIMYNNIEEIKKETYK